MIRTWRLAVAGLMGAAAACAPILGLDDLEPRPVVAGADSGVDASDAADGGSCTTHAQCIEEAFNNPARCVENKCVRVETTRLCNQQVLPSPELLKREDTILVAAFMQGANPQITGAGRAYSLALEELEAAGGILGSPQYHLAVLICDADPAVVEDGVRHVVDDLRVPAVIASFGTGTLAKVVADDIVKAGVFTINPSFTTDFLKFSRTDRLVWGLLGTGEDVALAYRPVLEQLRSEKQLGANAKVAIVATDGSLDKPMADLLELGQSSSSAPGGRDATKALAMTNGLPPQQDPANFRRFKIHSKEFPAPPDFDKNLADVKEALLAFAPDVIIALTGPELDSFFVEIDAQLYAKNNPADAGADAGAGTKGRPYWILGPSNGELFRGGQKTALGAYLDPAAPGVDRRRARVIGVQFAGAVDTKQVDGFRDRMRDKYKDAAVEGLASENFYDAIYWLAYAIAAAGPDAPVDGESFSAGVRKLFKGAPETEVNPGDVDTIQKAYIQIGKYPPSGSLFVGALGPPDINEPTGTWNSVGSTYCYPPWQEGKPAPTYEVRRYSPDGGLVPSSNLLTCSN